MQFLYTSENDAAYNTFYKHQSFSSTKSRLLHLFVVLRPCTQLRFCGFEDHIMFMYDQSCLAQTTREELETPIMSRSRLLMQLDAVPVHGFARHVAL